MCTLVVTCINAFESWLCMDIGLIPCTLLTKRVNYWFAFVEEGTFTLLVI